jgi:four helix bundle protein
VARERSYQDLVAWQKARVLVRDVYRLTRAWPKEELFLLTAQVRRAAISIPSNIAEGQGRIGKREFAHHLSIAHGSFCELENQLVIAQDLEFLSEKEGDQVLDQVAEVGRLLRGLLRSLE